MVDIYALCDPRIGAIRYIGKANCARKRFAGHLRDSRRRDTPVYRWIRKLASVGMVPELMILVSVKEDKWQETEISAISQAKVLGIDLLNVAEGGDHPLCPREVRAENGRKNAASRNHRLWWLKRKLGENLKHGYVRAETVAKMGFPDFAVETVWGT